MKRYKVSTITAIEPQVLSKTVSLVNGEIHKTSGGSITVGLSETNNLSRDQFVEMLQEAKSRNDIGMCMGAPEYDEGIIAIKDKVKGEKRKSILTRYGLSDDVQVFARSREYYSFTDAPGIFSLDYDPRPGYPVLTQQQLYRALVKACPLLERAPMLWTPSSGSCIYTTDGVEKIGIKGQRIYIFINHASAIPRIGDILFKRLWLKGFGYHFITDAGSLDKRTIVDKAIWAPEHFDFIGGVKCLEGLETRYVPMHWWNKEAQDVDVNGMCFPELTNDEEKAYRSLVEASRMIAAPLARAQKEIWKTKKADAREDECRSQGSEFKREQYLDMLERASEQKRLLGDFILESALHGIVTVSEVLDNPEKFHNTYFADPLEPEYHSHYMHAAKAYLHNHVPTLYSWAHGGCIYKMSRQLVTVKLEGGEIKKELDQILDLIGGEQVVYQRAGQLVRVADDEIIPAESGWLQMHCTDVAKFGIEKKQGLTFVNCPDVHAKILQQRQGEWGKYGIKTLSNVMVCPAITPQGRVIEKDGFDDETGVLLNFKDHWDMVPNNPTEDDAKKAARRLWHPFKEFPFVTANDAASYMALLFMTVSRPFMTVCPGGIISSVSGGTGKTILSHALQILTGTTPFAISMDSDETELKKELFATALGGTKTILFDDVQHRVKSAALDAFITSPEFKGRILGQSKNAKVSTNYLVMMTGRNVQVHGTLNRRFIWVKLDARCERPELRKFDLDPLKYVLDHRLEMVRNILVILRAASVREGKGRRSDIGTFGEWNQFIRDAVMWVGENKWLGDSIGDPGETLKESIVDDQETQYLNFMLHAWYNEFGSNKMTIGGAITKVDRAAADPTPLYEAMSDVCARNNKLNSRVLGNWLGSVKGRPVDGLRFEREQGLGGKGLQWFVIAEKMSDTKVDIEEPKGSQTASEVLQFKIAKRLNGGSRLKKR